MQFPPLIMGIAVYLLINQNSQIILDFNAIITSVLLKLGKIKLRSHRDLEKSKV